MNIIVVVDQKWGIGKNNDLLFHLKEDMKYFRQKTDGKVVAMGANTFHSLPHGALPNRTNIVLDDSGATHPDTVTVHNVEGLHKVLSQYDSENIYICGGAGFYRLMLPLCDVAFVTKVQADGNAQVFFPNLDDDSSWYLESQSDIIQDGQYNITFCIYRRKN